MDGIHFYFESSTPEEFLPILYGYPQAIQDDFINSLSIKELESLVTKTKRDSIEAKLSSDSDIDEVDGCLDEILSGEINAELEPIIDAFKLMESVEIPDCRNGAKCSNPRCSFDHPDRTGIACKWGMKCKSKTCPFGHSPKPKKGCRYGAKCRNPKCSFDHPDRTGIECKWKGSCSNKTCPFGH